MAERRKTVAAIVAALVLAVTLRADMMPVSRQDSGYRQLPLICDRTPFQLSALSSPTTCLTLTDLNSLPVRRAPGSNDDMEQTRSATTMHSSMDDGQNSLSLCLYALLGLGLYRSVPLVKKLSFGCVPDWYHHGGPFQTGHSLAIGPDCLCSAAAPCFIQPECEAEDLSPQYPGETIASLLQKPQFTPLARAPRGPPALS